MKPNRRQVIERIEQVIAKANYRASTRRLEGHDIAQVLQEALLDGYGYTSGGSVAKAYGQKGTPYTTMAFAVANGPDYVALRVERRNAFSSLVTWAGPSSARHSDCLAWAERQTLYTLRDWLILSRRECRYFISLMIRLHQPLSRGGLETVGPIPDVMVTLEDSIAAGNCLRVSERVAHWFAPATAVPAKMLICEIQKRDHPLLVSYAMRAIKQAAARQNVAA